MMEAVNKLQRNIEIPSEAGRLQGILTIPENAKAIIVFAHGSGSGRHSPRNQSVARSINEGHLATLLLDLLTPEEEEIDLVTRHLRFDVQLLARRLEEASHYLESEKETKSLKIGYFGSSTGAAAALIASASQGKKIYAIVSRGGRPDLAEKALSKVCSPTLLIVGGHDFGVIELNQQAFNQIQAQKKLALVPGATHLFEEPGALEIVSKLARDWFLMYL